MFISKIGIDKNSFRLICYLYCRCSCVSLSFQIRKRLLINVTIFYIYPKRLPRNLANSKNNLKINLRLRLSCNKTTLADYEKNTKLYQVELTYYSFAQGFSINYYLPLKMYEAFQQTYSFKLVKQLNR